VQRLHQDSISDLEAAGIARAYALSVEGRVVGAYYGFLHRERAYAYLGGFDPDFSFESPGTVLVGHAIEEAAREGAREFHFLRGGEAYKYEWGAVDRWNQRRSFRKADRGGQGG
jgi:CelD/BcsL family acetyltransferase involved in cellulose biosynthesis